MRTCPACTYRLVLVTLQITYSYLLLWLPPVLSKQLIVSSSADILRQRHMFSSSSIGQEGEEGSVEDDPEPPLLKEAALCGLSDVLSEGDDEWVP